jgi:hypothetical protein
VRIHIAFLPLTPENSIMNTTADSVTERQALLDRLTGKPLDPETYRRIRERAERITEELRQQHGEMKIAVDLVREIRDEE